MTAGSSPAPVAATPASRPVLWTWPFVMLLGAMLLGYCSNGIIAPVLPAFIIEQGGSPELVGLIVAIYSIPSVIARPPLGRLTDDWSRRGVFSLGLAGMVLACAGYLIPAVVVIAAVRLLHGFQPAAPAARAPAEGRGRPVGRRQGCRQNGFEAVEQRIEAVDQGSKIAGGIGHRVSLRAIEGRPL